MLVVEIVWLHRYSNTLGVTSPSVRSALNLRFHLCGRDITPGALYSVGLGGQTQVVRFGFYPFPQLIDQD